jgi:hypothetical protein
MTDPRRAGRDAYWSGMTLDQNPETGIARALWINGWERARALDDGIRAIDRDRNRDNVLAHEVNLLSGGLVLLSTTLEQRD